MWIFLRWKDQADTQGSNSYSYNPCSGFSEGSCRDVAVCQIANEGSYFNLGTQASAVFSPGPPGEMYLVYKHTDSLNTTRTSTIFLQCDNMTSSSVFTALGETDPGSGIYQFSMRSPHACPVKHGSGDGGLPLSYGSLISIGVAVVLIVYIVIGTVVQKFILHKEGSRIVPNSGCWTGFAHLVGDGIKFSFTCGSSSPKTYDKIWWFASLNGFVFFEVTVW